MSEKKKFISKLKKPFRHSRTGSVADSLKSHDDHGVDHSFHDDGLGDHSPDDGDSSPLPSSRKPPSNEAIDNFSRRLPGGNDANGSFGSTDNWVSADADNVDPTGHGDAGQPGVGYFYDSSKSPSNLPRRVSDSSYSRNSGEKQRQRYRDHTYVSPNPEDQARTTLDPKRFFDDQDEESFSSQNNPTSSSGGFNKYLSTFKPGNDNSSTAAIYGDTKENSPAVSLSPSRTGPEVPKTKLSSPPVTAQDSDDNEPLDASANAQEFGPIRTNFRGQPTTLQDLAKNKRNHGDNEKEYGSEKKDFQRTPSQSNAKDGSFVSREQEFAPIVTHFRGQPTTLQDMAKAKRDSSSSSGTISKDSPVVDSRRSDSMSSKTSSKSKPHKGRDLRYVDNDDASSEYSSTYSGAIGVPAPETAPETAPAPEAAPEAAPAPEAAREAAPAPEAAREAAPAPKEESLPKGSVPKNPEPFYESEIAELDKKISETMSQIKSMYVDPKTGKNAPRRSSSGRKSTGLEEAVGDRENNNSEKGDISKIAGVGAAVAGAAAVAGGAIGASHLKSSTSTSEPKDTYVSDTSAPGPKDTYVSKPSFTTAKNVTGESEIDGSIKQSVDTKHTNKVSETDGADITASTEVDGLDSRGHGDSTDLSETKQSVVPVSRSNTRNKDKSLGTNQSSMPSKGEETLLGDEDNDTYREAGGTLQDVIVTVQGTQDNDEAARIAKIAIEQLHDEHPDLLAESEELKIDYLSGAVIDQFGQKIAEVKGFGGPIENRYVKPSITRDPNRVFKGLQSDEVGPVNYHPKSGFIEELSSTEYPPNAYLASRGLEKKDEPKTSASKETDLDSPDTSFVSTTQDTPQKPTSTIPSTGFTTTGNIPLDGKGGSNTQSDQSASKDINLNESSQNSQSTSVSKDASKDINLEKPGSFVIPGSFVF